MALVPQVVDAVGPGVPVVASGGIMDGRGIAASLALGAQGVSLGTRFLGSAESGAADAYAHALPGTPAERTVVTDLVTGRPARWVRNRFIDALLEADPGTLGWGRQAALTGDLRRAAAEQGRADILPMLAGEGAALSGERRPAAEIVAQLVRETEAALAALPGRRSAQPRGGCAARRPSCRAARDADLLRVGPMCSCAKALNWSIVSHTSTTLMPSSVPPPSGRARRRARCRQVHQPHHLVVLGEVAPLNASRLPRPCVSPRVSSRRCDARRWRRGKRARARLRPCSRASSNTSSHSSGSAISVAPRAPATSRSRRSRPACASSRPSSACRSSGAASASRASRARASASCSGRTASWPTTTASVTSSRRSAAGSRARCGSGRSRPRCRRSRS